MTTTTRTDWLSLATDAEKSAATAWADHLHGERPVFGQGDDGAAERFHWAQDRQQTYLEAVGVLVHTRQAREAQEAATIRGGCTCHHWCGWGDSGSTVMRARCTSGAVQVRPSDGRKVCAACTDCNPADSEGYRQ